MFSHSISGHKNVRAALRDTETYSSDLQGDSDVRDYRQLPLESDPPKHHIYRAALSPMFVRPRIAGFEPVFREIATDLLERFEQNGGGEFVQDVALPYVISCLGVLYDRPQDVDEWLTWGPDVWTAIDNGRSGESLHNYIDRVFHEPHEHSAHDIWSFVKLLDIEGNTPDYLEFKGIAGVLLAGGRDTVVKLLSGSAWHLAKSPDDVSRLNAGEVEVEAAIQEFLRYFTPLPAMLRVSPEQHHLSDEERDPSKFVAIDFLSANFDADVFPNPEVIDISRTRIAHLAFGFGPHTCIGNHIAEFEAQALVRELLPRMRRWTIDGTPNISWNSRLGFDFPERIENLNFTVSK